MFVPLHTKSDYSPGYGTATIPELVSRAGADGYPALALTDVENLYGQPLFHSVARGHGLRPITGVELRSGYVPQGLGERGGRLVLLARDRSGYESICRILTARRAARRTEDPVRVLDHEPEGLFYLSEDPAVLAALIAAGVSRRDVRFLLIRPSGAEAPEGFTAVADPDVVMLDPADHELHRLLVAIRRRQTVFSVTGTEPRERSLPSPSALRALYADRPDALEEAGRVAEACSFDLGDWPRPPLLDSDGERPEDRLERRARERFDEGRRAGRWTDTRYGARLDHELSVLRELALGDYVLAVSEIADHARSRGIAVGGRGSAGGSLVAHVLGITPLDPIAYGLYFERFVHAERGDLPDIDLDLPSDRREAVLEWVLKRFGTKRAAMVSAHQTFRKRGAFREGLKALGMSTLDVNRFGERMPAEELEDVLPFPEHLLTGRYRDALSLILRLVGKFQHLSVHPGGVVLAAPRVDLYAPLERAPKGVAVTQYDLRGLGSIGLVKIDLLGNRALSAIEETLETVGHPDLPERDEATLHALRHADTIGCFQVETPPMRSLLRKLPLGGMTDLMAALAVVRPGPASGEAKSAYVRRARGETAGLSLSPRIAGYFADTHGMPLYEEDLMLAIAALTGRSLERADAFRAAIRETESDPAGLEALRHAFLEEAARDGVDALDAERVWDTLARFAAYSFNKAHAAGYAHIAWQTVYLKTHAPGPFAAAVLNSYGGIYPLRTLAADFSRHGVTILPPHVNASAERTSCPSDHVRLGLASIKRLTQGHRKQILAQRPFQSVRDLLERVPLGKRELEALVLCGACDDLPPLPQAAYPIAHQTLLERMQNRGDLRSLDRLEPGFPSGPRGPLYAALVRVRNELTYLGMHVSDHPMRLLRQEALDAGCMTMGEAERVRAGYVRLAGIVATARRVESRGGRIMQFVTFEDETGLIEALLLPGTFARLGDPIREPGPFLIGGRLIDEQGDLHLVVSEATPFHERPRPYRRAT